MLIRCFRVDRVYRGIINYITEIMGEQYVTPPHVSLDMIFEQSTPTMPVVFVLSPGSDPTSELMKLADRYGCGGGKFRHLSLGQSQDKVRARDEANARASEPKVSSISSKGEKFHKNVRTKCAATGVFCDRSRWNYWRQRWRGVSG